MQIKMIIPEEKYQDYIQKIAVFSSTKKIIYQQKITPSPFTCISYNHFDIPKFKINNQVAYAKNKIQVTGPKTKDDIYALHSGKIKQILIELTPSAFYYLFKRKPLDIVNQTVTISNYISDVSVEKLTKALSENNNYRSHIKKLLDFLSELKTQALYPVDYVESAINLIDESSGNITVNAVCRRINKSERQFNRKFTEIVGIPPIQYIKIRQLHFIIHLLQKRKHKSFKEMTYDTGFYDPAHFSKNFKRLTGMTPGVFINSDKHLAHDYFSEKI